ncbi:metal cation transporter, ZIP family protein (macronuclear) [Tetrahymena thermophila SB210]|uniref:Metal cation transporter, ZIP family protein n=1 Tax=Tetrahymena thermophila (strain SB210) TaxID=312017 RepID=Q23DL0_TETTS|nr:metal cation transporter, ZIP family protein [Tetrahymena thermophila SB210]EAR94575.1 metal cation transporter, ZIP family protein [Tetrahymena thermophila SB210]|eukprot:XP_001014676.1 metal cation transporter, ZIP family protein [Tetrahymena thermophila SB210]
MKQSLFSNKLLNYRSLFLNIVIFIIILNKFAYCADEHHEDHDHDHDEVNETLISETFSTEESWAYGMLTGVMLGILGFICSAFVVIVKKYTKISFDPFLKVLIAFAAGALIGDAVVHLLPHAFGSHSHEEASHDHEHEHEHEEHAEGEGVSMQLLSFFICLGIFVFALIERIFHMLGIAHSHGLEDSHSHSEGHECHNHKQINARVSSESIKLTSNPTSTEYNLTNIEKENLKQNSDQQNQEIQQEPENKEVQQNKVEELSVKQIDLTIGWKNKKPEGYMNLIADFLHNIMDGIALGVSFTSTTKSKAASTIVAIVAHEIPQEMGDVSILLNSNFSGLQAILCNGIINFSGLIGIIIGISVASLSENAERIMNCFIAGNFLFIGAAEMLPKLSEEKNNKTAFLQLFGLCVGFGVMFLITLAESDDHSH